MCFLYDLLRYCGDNNIYCKLNLKDSTYTFIFKKGHVCLHVGLNQKEAVTKDKKALLMKFKQDLEIFNIS